MKTKTTILTQGAYFVLSIITLALIDASGPIIFNIEQGCDIKHILSVLCFSAFNASIIVSIMGLLGKRSFTIFAGLYIVFALFSYVNLLYYRAFSIYMPVNMILSSNN